MVRHAAGSSLGGGWAPAGVSQPEHFGAVGDGITDDTAALIRWMEHGGEMSADGTYLVAYAGADAGGAYARLLNDVDFFAGPNCRFVAGEGLDNDILRYTAELSVYNVGKRPSIVWRGGVIDSTLQANSTIIPNSTAYPPIRPGASTTTDGLYILGWVQIGDAYFSALDSVTVEGVTFTSGDHWQTAGGDSQLFISGAKSTTVRDNEFVAGRDCGFYGSGLPSGEMPEWTCSVVDNVFRACNWGGAIKRQPRNLVMIGNRGINTPQMLVLSGLSGAGGTGGVIANNVGEQAWQVVRMDDVSGVECYGNVSINHGPLLADGSTPMQVYTAYNTVVRMQGCRECRVHDNILASVNPAAAGTERMVVHLNKGDFGPTTHCDVYDNRAFAGTTVIEERQDEADFNRFWGNGGPDAVVTPVILRGTSSINRDALTLWSSATTATTGTTETIELRAATVRARKLVRSGDAVTFTATGNASGTAGSKRITLRVGSSTVNFPLVAGEFEWVADGTVTTTGTSLRVVLRLVTSTGQSFVRSITAGYTPGAEWPITVSGGLTQAADTLTCTALRIS